MYDSPPKQPESKFRLESPGLSERSKVTVYRADNRFNDSLTVALSRLFMELIYFRSHTTTIFRRDFQASYHGTFFGIFWNFTLPLIPISIYILLASFRVLPSFEGVPSSVAIAFNATIWFLLAGCIQQPISVVRGRNAEAMKTALPLSVSIAASFGRVLFDTLVRLALLMVVIIATAVWPSTMAPLTIFLVALALFFFLGFGLLVSILNIIAPDVQRLVSVALQYGLFVSGVIFPLSKLGPLAILETINPFAVFITAARDLTFHGTITNVGLLAAWLLVGILLFIYAARLFYLMEYRIRGVQ